MNLVKGKQYAINNSPVYWVYVGTGSGFKCAICHNERKIVHEFLGYDNLKTLQREIKTGNYNAFNYNECYGTECIKKLDIK